MVVVADLENPFSAKNKSMREIAEEHNAKTLRLLLGICKTAKETLLSLQKSVPNSSLPRQWRAKLEAARKDYVEFAQKLGVHKADAESELARELGETNEAPSDAAP
jgi:hypothetical protein